MTKTGASVSQRSRQSRQRPRTQTQIPQLASGSACRSPYEALCRVNDLPPMQDRQIVSRCLRQNLAIGLARSWPLHRLRGLSMGRWGGYGRRTVEQTRSVDIDALRRAGFIGKPRSTWWVHRQRLSREGIRPTHWSNNGTITLDGQTLCIRQVPWHYGGQRAVFWCACGRRARKLYAPRGQPWRCRHCYQHTYATRQASRQSRLLMESPENP